MDKEKIQKQAKKIMDDFIQALDKVKEIKEEFGVRRDVNTRERTPCGCDPAFPKRFFKNAPKVQDDCLVMEKKKW